MKKSEKIVFTQSLLKNKIEWDDSTKCKPTVTKVGGLGFILQIYVIKCWKKS